MKIKKFFAAVSAITILGSMAAVPVMADTEGVDPVVLAPTYDTYLRSDKSDDYSGSDKVEVRYNPNGNDFVAVFRFDIPETPASKKIESATLKLVTERRKAGNTVFYIYPIDIEEWNNEKDLKYKAISSAIDSARKSDHIGSFVPAGLNNKAIWDGFTDGNYLSVESWTNQISLDAGAVTPGKFDFIISNDSTKDPGNQTCFYTKDNGEDTEISIGRGNGDTITGDQVIPSLTITYADDPEAEGKAVCNTTQGTYYDNFASAIEATVSGDTLELLDDVTIDARITINSEKDLTINGNGHKINCSSGKYLQIENGSVVLNINNVDIGELEMTGHSKLYADGVTFGTLKLSGANTANKGSIKNSSITLLQTYGDIILENTSVTNVNIPQINNTADRPVVHLNGTSSVSGKVTVQKINENAVIPYTLFDGSNIPETAEVPEGYTYANGVISKAEAASDEYFKFDYTADTQRTFKTIILNAVIDGAEKVGENELSTEITLEPNASGVFYVQVTNVPENATLKSMTLN